MNPVKRVMYRCLQCRGLYDREEQAQQCCLPEVTKEEMWKCWACDKTWNTKDKAEACCKER